jgi:hypothetical protein
VHDLFEQLHAPVFRYLFAKNAGFRSSHLDSSPWAMSSSSSIVICMVAIPRVVFIDEQVRSGSMSGPNLAHAYRGSAPLSVAIRTAALKELTSASPTATHNTAR